MLIAALVLAGIFVGIWAITVAIRDASIVDIAWGPAFATVAWVSVATHHPTSPRGVLAASIATVWGLRLGLHLARRNLGHGEDKRYASMRASTPHFWIVSLPMVFLVQAALAWVVSLPLQVAARPSPIDAWAIAGAAVSVAGIAIEGIADAQLAAFRRDPASKGQVMDRGLWGWSRHPNYFGDAVIWWGLGLVTARVAPWALVGPAAMTLFLLKVSGVSLLERTIVERRPAYRDYITRTSAFILWPPKKKAAS